MKSLIATISIISIAFGYIIGKLTISSSKDSDIASNAETRYDLSKSHDARTSGNGENALLDSILAGRPISEIPAADLAAIIIKLSKRDLNADDFSRAKQAYQLQCLLSKLSAKDLANIATELCSNPETKYSQGAMKIIATLAAKDPDRALDWISTREDDSKFYPIIISTIAENDPLTASSVFRSAIIDSKIADIYLPKSIASDIGESTAKLGVDPFLGFLDSMPMGFHNNIIYESISNIPENDHIKFLDQIHQRIQDGRLSGIEIENVFSHTIIENKAAATEWLNKLPDNEQKNNLRIRGAKSLFLCEDKESGIELMKESIAAAPGREKEIIHDAIQYLQSSEPEGIPVFANLLPEGLKLTAKDISFSPDDGTEGISLLASALSDPNEKSIFIANSINKIITQSASESEPRMSSKDLEALSRQVAAMGFNGQNATRVNDAIEAAKKQLAPSN